MAKLITFDSVDFQNSSYQAPFFTTWFVTNWTMLFFPLYFISRLSRRRCESISDILSESIRDFRDKGFTAGKCDQIILQPHYGIII